MNYYFEVLKKYAVFSGRARRKEYWYFIFFSMLVSLIIGVVDLAFRSSTINGNSFYSNIYQLVVLVPSLAVTVRRMHDVGKRGWYLLIPIYNLILACTKGTTGSNQYGPDPKIG